MNLVPTDDRLRRAIVGTHVGYYRIGMMTQDLVWEEYRYPIPLSGLLQGNSAHVIFEENQAVPIEPPSLPQSDVVIDKTGSTSGFGAYVAFIPRRKMGVVLLANKSFPIAARVTAAYRILTRLGATPASLAYYGSQEGAEVRTGSQAEPQETFGFLSSVDPAACRGGFCGPAERMRRRRRFANFAADPISIGEAERSALNGAVR
jgi:hypothetical protein